MIPPARLQIGLLRGHAFPLEGATAVNDIQGGPLQLLGWIESQLGVNGPNVPFTDRVVDYLRRLRAVAGASYSDSLAQDGWATAVELLQRRDALLLAGWRPNADNNLPQLVLDLARAETHDLPLRPGVPERLDAVLRALNAGFQLPAHRLRLEEPIDAWPRRWQDLLSRLTLEPTTPPSTPDKNSALQAFQVAVRNGAMGKTWAFDASFQVFEAQSRHSAVQAAIGLLSSIPDRRRVCIVSHDPHAAATMDSALAAHGWPTTGAAVPGAGQPAMQVLPLALQLCWKPVNPYVLLDFLVLPLGPIPRKAGFRLARALAQEPGFGSDAWNEVWKDLTSLEHDPDRKVQERLDAWLTLDRIAQGKPLPVSLVHAVCARVAQWAAGQAQYRRSENADDALAASLDSAAAQAKAVSELASATFGREIPANQLRRLLEDVVASSSLVTPHLPQAGGPCLVQDFADVPEGIDVLVWLGTACPPPRQSPWTLQEQQTLQDVGLLAFDPVGQAALEWGGAARALARTSRMIVFRFPQGEDTASHPLWLQLSGWMKDDPVSIEASLGKTGAESWLASAGIRTAAPALTAPLIWEIPSASLVLPEKESATGLETRLACPLKWTLHHAARISRGLVVAIPDDFPLKGSLAHKLFEHVFGGDTVPSPAAARQRMGEVFDDVLERNAAPLAEPARMREREELRQSMLQSAEDFAQCLQAGKYRVVAMEHTISDKASVGGRIDCVVANPDGEGIIDLKFSSRDKHATLLEEGRAVQLAVYATGRAEETNVPVKGVGYYVLNHSRLATPAGSALAGTANHNVVPGPDIQDTWRRFRMALDAASDWLGTGQVPARPLQNVTARPPGTDIVLAFDQRKQDRPDCCKYCDYGLLCGLEAPQ